MADVPFETLLSDITTQYGKIKTQQEFMKQQQNIGEKTIKALKQVHPKAKPEEWYERKKQIEQIKSTFGKYKDYKGELSGLQKELKEQEESLKKKKAEGWKLREKGEGYEFYKTTATRKKISIPKVSQRMTYKLGSETHTVLTHNTKIPALIKRLQKEAKFRGVSFSYKLESLAGKGSRHYKYTYRTETDPVETVDTATIKKDTGAIGTVPVDESNDVPEFLKTSMLPIPKGKGITVFTGVSDPSKKIPTYEQPSTLTTRMGTTATMEELSKVTSHYDPVKYREFHKEYVSPYTDWKVGDPSPHLTAFGIKPDEEKYKTAIKEYTEAITSYKQNIANIYGKEELFNILKNISKIKESPKGTTFYIGEDAEAKSKEEALKFYGGEFKSFIKEKPSDMKQLPKMKYELGKLQEGLATIQKYKALGYEIEKTDKGGYAFSIKPAWEVHEELFKGKIGIAEKHRVILALESMKTDLPFFPTLIEWGKTQVTGDPKHWKEAKESLAMHSLSSYYAGKKYGIEGYIGHTLGSPSLVSGVYIPLATAGVSYAFSGAISGLSATVGKVPIVKQIGTGAGKILGSKVGQVVVLGGMYTAMEAPTIIAEAREDIRTVPLSIAGTIPKWALTIGAFKLGATLWRTHPIKIETSFGKTNLYKGVKTSIFKIRAGQIASDTYGKLPKTVRSLFERTGTGMGKIKTWGGEAKERMGSVFDKSLKSQIKLSQKEYIYHPEAKMAKARQKMLESQYGLLGDARVRPRMGYGLSYETTQKLRPEGGWLRQPHVSAEQAGIIITTGRYDITGISRSEFGKKYTFEYKSRTADMELDVSQRYKIDAKGKAITVEKDISFQKGSRALKRFGKELGISKRQMQLFEQYEGGFIKIKKGQTAVFMKGRAYTTFTSKKVGGFGITEEGKYLTGRITTKPIKYKLDVGGKLQTTFKMSVGKIPKGMKITTFEGISLTDKAVVPTGYSKGYVAGKFKGYYPEAIYGGRGRIGIKIGDVGVSTYTRTGVFTDYKGGYGRHLEYGSIYDVSKTKAGILLKTGKPIGIKGKGFIRYKGKKIGDVFYQAEKARGVLETGEFFESVEQTGKLDISELFHAEAYKLTKAPVGRVIGKAPTIVFGKTVTQALTLPKTEMIFAPISITKEKQKYELITEPVVKQAVGVKEIFDVEQVTELSPVMLTATKPKLEVITGLGLDVTTKTITEPITDVASELSTDVIQRQRAELKSAVKTVTKLDTKAPAVPSTAPPVDFTISIVGHERVTKPDKKRIPPPKIIPPLLPLGKEEKVTLTIKKRKYKTRKPKKEKSYLVKTVLADPMSVMHSQALFGGKATHPLPTKKVWSMAKRKGYKLPTVELLALEKEKKTKSKKEKFDFTLGKKFKKKKKKTKNKGGGRTK